jgi:hypothetical protein
MDAGVVSKEKGMARAFKMVAKMSAPDLRREKAICDRKVAEAEHGLQVIEWYLQKYHPDAQQR